MAAARERQRSAGIACLPAPGPTGGGAGGAGGGGGGGGGGGRSDGPRLHGEDGRWTPVAQPRRSKIRIRLAERSIWCGRLPCLAQAGAAWCPLCQLSPKEIS